MNIETTPQILKDLVMNTNSKSAIISTSTGLTMFKEFNAKLDEDRVAASTSAVMSIAQNIAKETSMGDLEQITFKTSNGKVIIQSISENSIITLFTEADVDLKYVSERLNSGIALLNEPANSLELV